MAEIRAVPEGSARNRMNGFIKNGGETPPLLFEDLRKEDVQTLSLQMRGRAFDASIVRGIAQRCPWGKPVVIVCGPLRRGKPFPTTFWLTCPFLDRKCGQLESEGAVGQMEEFLAEPGRENAWAKYNLRAALVRSGFLSEKERQGLGKETDLLLKSMEGVGVGGIRLGDNPSVKCIHLQVATWLGLEGHPAGEWLSEKLGRLDCAGAWRLRCENEEA